MTEGELAFLQAIAVSLPPGAQAVEVGSWKGRSTVAICEALEGREVTLWSVDTFEGDPDIWQEMPHVERDAVIEEFRNNTVGFTFLHSIVADSAEASRQFDVSSLDWVFIDGYHAYDQVVRDISAWQPKLKPDGLLSGHDYDHLPLRQAVQRFFGDVCSWETIWYTREQPRPHLLPIIQITGRRLLASLGRSPEQPARWCAGR